MDLQGSTPYTDLQGSTPYTDLQGSTPYMDLQDSPAHRTYIQTMLSPRPSSHSQWPSGYTTTSVTHPSGSVYQ